PLYMMHASPIRLYQSLIFTSRQGTLHSLLPSKLLTHSTPIPVHSALASSFLLTPSAAASAIARTVLFSAVARNEISSDVEFGIAGDLLMNSGIGLGRGDERCRGSNQLLWKSKKQWSDQLQDEMKSIK